MSRHLGAGWAAIHGPADARALAVWALEQGFRGLMPAPAPRPVDWAGLAQVAADLPFELLSACRLCAVSEVDDRADRGLGSRNRGDVQAAVATIEAAVVRARALGLRRVVLEPGAVHLAGETGTVDLAGPDADWTVDRAAVLAVRRDVALDAALDGVCRALHGACKAFPDMEFCLTTSRCVDSVGTPRGLEAIFEDLGSRRLGYWHEAAIAACREIRLQEPQGEWLERFAPRMRGLTASDWADGQLHLPPGSGLVDYPLVANYVPLVTGGFPVVVELDPGIPPGEVPGVHSFLDKFGL